MASADTGSVRAERRARELLLRQSDVIAAASAVFAKKGFQGAQVSEIAAAAELSTKSVYALFASKEALYQEVIRTAAEAVRDKVQEQVEKIEDPRAQLLALIDCLFSCFDQHQNLLLLYAKSTHGLPWKVRQNMGETSLHIFQDFTKWIISIAEQAKRSDYLSALEPEAVAVSIVGTVTTSAARWVENKSEEPVSSLAPAVRAIFAVVLEKNP